MNNLIPNVIQLGWGGDNGWGTSIVQTIYMTFWPAIFGGILGLIFGVALVVTEPGGILENRIVFSIVDKVVSVFRAIPFIILLAFIAPFTQLIVGTQIGTTAALVPLSLGVFAFYARQVQVALESVMMNNYSGNETVNAGTGKELTIKELTELVAKVVGYDGEIKWDSDKPNGTPRKLLDVSKAKNLGWTYKTELEDGIRLAYEDFLNNPMRAER